MGFKLKDGLLWNDNGKAIAIMTDDISAQEENIIESSFDLAAVAVEFVEQVESGSHKPKKAFDEFKKVIDKYEIETT